MPRQRMYGGSRGAAIAPTWFSRPSCARRRPRQSVARRFGALVAPSQVCKSIFAWSREPSLQAFARKLDHVGDWRAPRARTTRPASLVILYSAFADFEPVGERLLRPAHPTTKCDQFSGHHGATITPSEKTLLAR